MCITSKGSFHGKSLRTSNCWKQTFGGNSLVPTLLEAFKLKGLKRKCINLGGSSVMSTANTSAFGNSSAALAALITLWSVPKIWVNLTGAYHLPDPALCRIARDEKLSEASYSSQERTLILRYALGFQEGLMWACLLDNQWYRHIGYPAYRLNFNQTYRILQVISTYRCHSSSTLPPCGHQ